MQLYVCSGKESYNGKTHYLLRDIRNNKEEIVDGDKLKKCMRLNKVDVMNLTLTSDNRLVEASKDKIAQLSGILKSPDSIRNEIIPINPKYETEIERVMDEILHDCISYYVKDAGKYVKLGHFNKENNTCILEFTLGINSYVMIHYDKIVYGQISNGSDEGDVCFDIGIQIVAISNRRASSKIGDGAILKASEVNKVNYRDYIQLCYKVNNGSFAWKEKDDSGINNISRLKERLGKGILEYVSSQLISICENNPDIANNTNIADYIEYDETKKEYIKYVGQTAGITLGCTVVMGAFFALCIATNPELLQTGLLAKIANVGTTEQIFKAVATYAGGAGFAISGAVSTATASSLGMFEDISRLNKQTKQLKENKKRDWMGILGK